MKKKILCASFILFFLMVNLFGEKAIEIAEKKISYVEFSGKIIDSTSKKIKIIKGAEIKLSIGKTDKIFSVKSDNKGKFKMSIPQGTYSLEITCEGYKDYSSKGLYITKNIEKTFQLSLRPGKIYGYVKASSLSIPKVEIQLYNPKIGKYSTASNHKGFFQIDNLPYGKYTLSFSKDGYEKTTKTVKISNIPFEINITLEKKRTKAKEEMAVTTVNEVLKKDKDVDDGHFRGGRDDEVAHIVDGANVSDPKPKEEIIIGDDDIDEDITIDETTVDPYEEPETECSDPGFVPPFVTFDSPAEVISTGEESEVEKKSKVSFSSSASSSSGLKAGFVDDNKQYNYFIKFLDEKKSQVNSFQLDISERIKIRFLDKKGKTLPNVALKIFDKKNNLLDEGKTYAKGDFLFFPSEHGNDIYRYTGVANYKGKEKTFHFDRQGLRNVDITFDDLKKEEIQTVPLDILFILDTTGSMGEEINRLRKTIEIINLNLLEMSPKPGIRFGMVLYRDKGDNYVTKEIDFTDNLEVFQEALADVQAGGGGDTPEDLQEALDVAIKKMDWRKDGVKLSFVITDAPPHLYPEQKEYNYIINAHKAKEKGIKIFTIGTGGLDLTGEYILRQISQYTSAKYVFLTYGEKGNSEGGRPGSVSHHTEGDFQTDKLEAIIIRSVKEELFHYIDVPYDAEEEYFAARKIEDEEKDETLKKLFDDAITQLIDYSAIRIDKGTPAAVVPISTVEKGYFKNADYLTNQLTLSLISCEQFKALERKNMSNILKELEFQLSDLVDQKNAVKVGAFVGAKMMICGELYGKNDNYELFLKLLKVETGEVLSVTKARIDKELGI